MIPASRDAAHLPADVEIASHKLAGIARTFALPIIPSELLDFRSKTGKFQHSDKQASRTIAPFGMSAPSRLRNCPLLNGHSEVKMKSMILMAAVLAAGSASAAPPDYPQTASLNNEPTAAETAVARSALEHAFGNEWTDYEKNGKKVNFSVGHADINGDGRPDLLVYLSDYGFGYCGSAGCSGYAILATSKGYANEPIYIANFYGKLTVLPAIHKGMHDLRCDDSHYIFKWSGKEYA